MQQEAKQRLNIVVQEVAVLPTVGGHWEGDRRKQQGQLVWTGLDGESEFFFIALCCEARSALCRVHGVSP